jgi:MFS transporter, DHA2 family, multidrug resistance protein
MMSVAQAILLRNYPIERRGMAIALWAMVIIIAPICGPILGGWITDNLSWPWLFYINLPVGAFCAMACWSILRKRESTRRQICRSTSSGLLLLIVGVGSLQFMLDNGNDKDWFNSGHHRRGGRFAGQLSFLIPWELTDASGGRSALFAAAISAWPRSSVPGLFRLMGVNILFPLWLQTTVGYTAT